MEAGLSIPVVGIILIQESSGGAPTDLFLPIAYSAICLSATWAYRKILGNLRSQGVHGYLSHHDIV